MQEKTTESLKALGIIGALLAVIGIPLAGWVTHVVSTIMVGAWLLLAIGAFVPPVGVIHGIMIWFGVPWF